MGAPHGALEQDLARALGDAVDCSAQARALFATDASNYRQVPIALVTPRSRADVIETVRICREHGAWPDLRAGPGDARPQHAGRDDRQRQLRRPFGDGGRTTQHIAELLAGRMA